MVHSYGFLISNFKFQIRNQKLKIDLGFSRAKLRKNWLLCGVSDFIA